MAFQKATKAKAKARIALVGVTGSGKTRTALSIAQGLGGRVALIDTERGSASLYADTFDFDVEELSTFSPDCYMHAIKEAEQGGYDVLIIDSLSHAWAGPEGVLEFVDQVAQASRSGNKFAAWAKATPLQNKLIDAILSVRQKMHVIVTMRAKTLWDTEKDERGKIAPKKIGLGAVQREGVEYEFDIIGYIDQSHSLIVDKSRWDELDGRIVEEAGKANGEELGRRIGAWLADGVERAPGRRGLTREDVEREKQSAELSILCREIDSLFEKLGAENGDRESALTWAQRGATSLLDLKVPGARKLRDGLRRKLDQKVSEDLSNSGNGNPPPPPRDPPKKRSGKGKGGAPNGRDAGIVTALEGIGDGLSTWESGFASSLRDGLKKHGSLTDKQRAKAKEVLGRHEVAIAYEEPQESEAAPSHEPASDGRSLEELLADWKLIEEELSDQAHSDVLEQFRIEEINEKTPPALLRDVIAFAEQVIQGAKGGGA